MTAVADVTALADLTALETSTPESRFAARGRFGDRVLMWLSECGAATPNRFDRAVRQAAAIEPDALDWSAAERSGYSSGSATSPSKKVRRRLIEQGHAVSGPGSSLQVLPPYAILHRTGGDGPDGGPAVATLSGWRSPRLKQVLGDLFGDDFVSLPSLGCRPAVDLPESPKAREVWGPTPWVLTAHCIEELRSRLDEVRRAEHLQHADSLPHGRITIGHDRTLEVLRSLPPLRTVLVVGDAAFTGPEPGQLAQPEQLFARSGRHGSGPWQFVAVGGAGSLNSDVPQYGKRAGTSSGPAEFYWRPTGGRHWRRLRTPLERVAARWEVATDEPIRWWPAEPVGQGGAGGHPEARGQGGTLDLPAVLPLPPLLQPLLVASGRRPVFHDERRLIPGVDRTEASQFARLLGRPLLDPS